MDWAYGIRYGLTEIERCHDLTTRLLKQRKRVQDPSLLSTKNLHEVKHWVEPGVRLAVMTLTRTNINSHPDLVHYGWGQWDPDEETRQDDRFQQLLLHLDFRIRFLDDKRLRRLHVV